jgi:hypothetical protein
MHRKKDLRRSSDKPICYACNRPFDPKSEGATSTMGPTCAKRAAGSPTSGLVFETQLTFLEDEALSAPLAIPPNERRRARRPQPKLPKSLGEKAEAAKLAFDDLQREFSKPLNIYYREEARLRFEELMIRKVERHSFGDPSLPWLAPQFDIHLLIDHENRLAYYWRVYNESSTLIMIDPRASKTARENIAVILNFSETLTAYREAEAAVQLSFPCQMTIPSLFDDMVG